MCTKSEAQMEVESTATLTSTGTQGPFLFAPSAAASSSVLPAPATQTEDALEQTPVEQEEDEEMFDAPRCWTAWDDNNSGMGPYTR
jgi:hypothetical protein